MDSLFEFIEEMFYLGKVTCPKEGANFRLVAKMRSPWNSGLIDT